MNKIDGINQFEIGNKNGIEEKIGILMNQINKDFSFKGDTLVSLLNFKLEKGKQETINTSEAFKEDLIKEIGTKALSGDIKKNNDEELSFVEYGVLANKIIEVNQLTSEIQKGIQELRAEMLEETFAERFLSSSSLLTKGFYSQETINRIDNPKTLTDNLIGLGAGFGETIYVFGKIGFDLVKGVFFFIGDSLKMARGQAKYGGNIKV